MGGIRVVRYVLLHDRELIIGEVIRDLLDGEEDGRSGQIDRIQPSRGSRRRRSTFLQGQGISRLGDASWGFLRDLGGDRFRHAGIRLF